ncbi:hypothetical protein [Azospirillum palustre]|uniref:hypothetical protein n=1 Tax=Azospirillum palustre TaxID=2044885 RepID=UPI0011780078|nr:hypothetical protein [Azospirillum palustre]
MSVSQDSKPNDHVIDRVRRVLRKGRRSVYVLTDFADCGTPSAVRRALRDLERGEEVTKVSLGAWAKLQPSRWFSGERMLTKDPHRIAVETMMRFGYKPRQTPAERDYNEGRSTQVPTGQVIGLDRPTRRKVVVAGMTPAFVAVRKG